MYSTKQCSEADKKRVLSRPTTRLILKLFSEEREPSYAYLEKQAKLKNISPRTLRWNLKKLENPIGVIEHIKTHTGRGGSTYRLKKNYLDYSRDATYMQNILDNPFTIVLGDYLSISGFDKSKIDTDVSNELNKLENNLATHGIALRQIWIDHRIHLFIDSLILSTKQLSLVEQRDCAGEVYPYAYNYLENWLKNILNESDENIKKHLAHFKSRVRSYITRTNLRVLAESQQRLENKIQKMKDNSGKSVRQEINKWHTIKRRSGVKTIDFILKKRFLIMDNRDDDIIAIHKYFTRIDFINRMQLDINFNLLNSHPPIMIMDIGKLTQL